MVHHSKFLYSALVVSAMAVGANAQVTTSAISGKVLDETKAPVIGATVVAIHEPSGTLYGAVTNVDGRYTIQGMRTGGPYKIEISYVGYNKTAFTGISLELGNTLSLNAEMKPSSELLDEVVVVADAKANAGAAHNFSTQKIENTPTVDRNVYDIVKNMPMAMTSKNGGITFAGSNNRYNSFQIDGTVSNDVFGLSASGTNGGQTGANPISMDAIQEIQVVVAPFDVRQSGFTGGGINAITKQGTNKFQATAYSYFTNENMYGKYNAARDYEKQKLGEQHTRTFGGTIGGALIKNKLFYFVSAEHKSDVYPNNIYPGYIDNYLTQDMADRIISKYQEYTGIKETYGPRDIENKSFGLLARIDWNINQNHKLAIRYQHNNSYDDNLSLSSSSFRFNSSGYRMNNKTNSIVAELNSHLGESLYNELRASASFVRDNRDIDYNSATVQIKSANDNNNTKIDMGTEYSSGANYLNQDIYTFEDNLSWYKGNHTFTFGTHNEIYRMQNLFMQGNNGAWYFNSIEDFLNDNPYEFRYKYTDPTLTGGNLSYAPAMKSGQFGFYAQDKWNVTNNFELTYGIRFDIPVIFNDPTTNVSFNEFATQQGWEARVGEMPGAKVLVSPRVGFRWYLNENHRTLLRGGLGLFTGRVPFVWLNNSFTNNGMEQKGTTLNEKYVAVPGMKDYAKNPYEAVSGKPIVDIAVVDKDFKYPQVFRTNLALEQQLPGDVKLTIEGIYSKTLNNVFFENLAIEEVGKVYAIPGLEQSAVPYYNQVSSNYNSIINLKNTNEGYSYNFSVMLEKHFNFGLDLSGSYTFGHSKSVNDGTSSVAYSNWQYNYSKDSNSKGELGYSRFDIPHRISLQASYTTPKYLNGWMSTTVGITYNASPGGRYSLSYDDAKDFNGDGSRGTTLLYIPTDKELEDMNFVDNFDKQGNLIMSKEESREAFRQWILNDDYAKNHRGQFAERNSNLTKWEHEINLHVAQDIFYLKERGSKIQVTFDVINFANMLNKKWGANYYLPYNLTPVTVSGSTNADGILVPEYTFKDQSNVLTKNDISSRWHCQVGVRLTF
ncbi:TonB-dependent receptor domain-containing protein [Phocaeicola plebeius]|uniref:TonB-dependent receptor n=1 Tax=Phocaeicola plebeius TaxID=310297 RepID=UPI0026EE113C|nr:TonB-dependent receptor [Phocaeicola plebeius]